MITEVLSSEKAIIAAVVVTRLGNESHAQLQLLGQQSLLRHCGIVANGENERLSMWLARCQQLLGFLTRTRRRPDRPLSPRSGSDS
jgi:hypothetical protein